MNPYDIGLPKNAANYQPLTPLTFLPRAASVFPDRPAIVHGEKTTSYRELYRRSRHARGALRSSHGRGGAERDQYPTGPRHHRLKGGQALFCSESGSKECLSPFSLFYFPFFDARSLNFSRFV